MNPLLDPMHYLWLAVGVLIGFDLRMAFTLVCRRRQ